MIANISPKLSATRDTRRSTSPFKAPASRKWRSALYAGLSTAVITAAWGLTPTASAANLTWDSSGANPGAPVDGPGTWDTSSALWSFGGTDVAWNNAGQDNVNLDTAVFGGATGTGGVVTLGGPITAGGVTFAANGYTLSGNTLTLGTATPTITFTGATASIGSVLAGNSPVMFTGVNGALTLGGVNTYTGNTTINGGIVELLSGSSLATIGTISVASGSSTLTIDSGASFTATPSLSDTGGVINFNNSAPTIAALTGTGTVNLSATTTLTVSASGTFSGAINGGGSLVESGGVLALSGANTYSGSTSINGGTIQIIAANGLGNGVATNTISMNGGTLESTAGTYDLGTTRTITLNGPGTIQSDGTSVLTISGAITNGSNLLTITGAGNVTISGAIGSGSGAVTKTGAGTLSLTNSNNGYSGGTNINGGTVSFSTLNNLGSGPISFANGGTLLYASGTSDISTRTVTIGAGGGTINTNGGPVAYANSIGNGGSGGLTVLTGAGKLTLSASNNYTGGTVLGNGTPTAGNVTLGNIQALGSTSGTVTINGNGSTLDIATDTSVAAYNLSVAGNIGATIVSDKATLASAGISDNFGTLSIANATLATTAGSNVSGGSPAVSFTSTAVTVGTPTFAPASAALSLGNVTGTNTSVILGGTFVGANTVGSLNIGTGTLTKTTAATWTFNGTGTYSGLTTLGGGTVTIASSSNSGTLTNGPFGTSAILTNSGVTFAVSGSQGIGNPITLASSGSSFTGAGTLTLNGLVTDTASGGPTFNFNGTQTNFAGGFNLSTTTGARTVNFAGTGNVTVSGVLGNGATTAGTFNYDGTGTLTLTGANTVTGAATTFSLGTTVLGPGGSMAGNPITVANGAAVTATAGNAVMKVAGNYTIGTSGSPSLTIKGGTGTTTGQGTLILQDGTINTLTINSATAGANVLTMGSTTAASPSIFSVDIGQGGTDEVLLGSGLKATINANTSEGVLVNVNGLGGSMPSIAQTILNAPGNTTAFTTGTGNMFKLGTVAGNMGGYTTATLGTAAGTNGSQNQLTLTLTGLTAAPAQAFWSGAVDSTWSDMTGGFSNNSNWVTLASGGTDTHQVPGGTTDVVFSATSSANPITTLGANFTINSLTYSGAAATGSITGNTLTISAGAGNGITDNATTAQTINSAVALGASQTWTNNSASALTVNGNITGNGKVLTTAGSGTIVLGGTNSFTGGLAINAGVVQLTNASALSSSIPVSFGPSAASGTKLQINNQNVTIGALSTNATPGSPAIENGGNSNATITVSQNSITTYAGVLRDGGGSGTLGMTKSGTGNLTLSGVNTYSGPTTVGNGTLTVNGSLGGSSAVTVAAAANNTTALLAGVGTINGSVSLSAPTGTGRINEISPAGVNGGIGTLNIGNGLSFNSGTIGYFDIANGGSNDTINVTGGGLTAPSGTLIRVTGGLTSTDTYNLIDFTGTAPSLSNFTLQDLTGNSLPSGFQLMYSGDILQLQVTSTTKAAPTITISAPTSGTRVMMNTSINLTGGTVGNTGTATLNGTLHDNGGNLTVSGFIPSGTITLAPNTSTGYTATIANTGTNLGMQTFGVNVNDPNADPQTASANGFLYVLGNRVVSASASTTFGSLHVGSSVSVPVSLTSPGDVNSYTMVTVGNAAPDGNGISVTGGNTSTVFNGTNSDTRTISGTFNALGSVNGPIVLTTTGEGLTGESPINVSIPYSAQIFSGNAGWVTNGSGSWGVNTNWADTVAGDAGGAGAPGLAGAVSTGDTALFGSATSGSPITVTLDGVSPSLAGMYFNGTGPVYTIATGSTGSGTGKITLQNAATPIDVVNGVTATISAVMQGSTSGINKTSPGTLVLTGVNTYGGGTQISNGILQVSGGDNRLPTSTVVTLGSGSNSGQLFLGDGSTGSSETVAGLATSGTGMANVVNGGGLESGGLFGYPTLTVSVSSGTQTYSGTLGDGGNGGYNNYFNLTKTGAGTQILAGSDGLSGVVTISAGTLGLGNTNAVSSATGITFPQNTTGILQFSAANTTDLSSTGQLSAVTVTNEPFSFDTNGQTVTFAGTLSSAGVATLTKTGAGTLIVNNGVFNGTGVVTINGGVLQSFDQFPNSSKIVLANGTTPNAYGIFQSNGSFTRTVGTNFTWAGANTGFAAKGAPLTVNLGGPSLNWSANFIGSGTSALAFGSSTSDNQVTLMNGFDLGTNATTKGASLSAGFNRNINVDGLATLVGGTSNFGITGSSAVISGVIAANNPRVSIDTTPNDDYGDYGNNGIIKTGLGTLVLTGANTYSGTTWISEGTLIAGTNSALNTAGAFGDGHTVSSTGVLVNVTNGAQKINLGFGGNGGDAGTTATGASPTLLVGGAFAIAVPINIAVPQANVPIATTGTYVVGGSTDSISTLSGLITAYEPFTVTQVATTGSDALNITGGITAGVTLTAANKTVTFANVGPVNVSGTAISDGNATNKMALVDNGSGTVTLSGPNTYTGGTTVNVGTLTGTGSSPLGGTTSPLAVNNPNMGAGTAVTLNLSTTAATTTGSLSGTIATPSSGTNTATINNGGQLLTVNETTPGTFAGSIAGAGGFTLGSLSTSTLTLSGSNSYSGNTTIAHGTLAITGSGSIANSPHINLNGGSLDVSGITSPPFVVGASQTLMGQGTVVGAVNIAGTIQTGQTNNIGGKTAATLTLGTGSTLGGSTLMDLTAINASDEITVGSGLLNFGGTVNVTNPNSIAFAAGQSYDLFGFGSDTGTFSNLPVGSAVTPASLPTLGSGLVWNTSTVYSNGIISIVSTGPANLFFTGSAGNGNWDTATTTNFTAGAGAVVFHANDNVTFDDTTGNGGHNTGQFTVAVASGGVVPTSMTVTGTTPYTFSGGNIGSGSSTALTVASGASMTFDRGAGSRVTLELGSLSNSGKIDLKDNHLIVHNTTQLAADATTAALFTQLQNGFAGGTWAGGTSPSILSSTAAGSSLYTLGEVESGTDVSVFYAYYGDADLSGHVDGTDYSLIDTGFGSAGALTGWQNGDFNYDGHIDGSDYSLIDNSFNTQLATAPAAQIAVNTSEIAGGSAAVPEPASLGLLGIGAIGLMSRRRRRS